MENVINKLAASIDFVLLATFEKNNWPATPEYISEHCFKRDLTPYVTQWYHDGKPFLITEVTMTRNDTGLIYGIRYTQGGNCL